MEKSNKAFLSSWTPTNNSILRTIKKAGELLSYTDGVENLPRTIGLSKIED